jgi:amidohydrolase
MPIINRIAEFHADMTEWRRHIHANPETAFEEFQTADFVAEKLESFGIEVHRGLAGTGVVGSLKGAKGDGPAIGLRADMDALNMEEKNEHPWRSRNPGKMHACGHDGHTTMLLGAARYLAETRNFAGTVRFIFQPAEENEGGGRVMVEDGLFEKFDCESVWGMHNFPGQDLGTFAVCRGPAMAAADRFDIRITGKGGHAAAPHLATDSILAGSHLVTAVQSIASRNIDPLESVVVTITQFHAGDAYNIIPEDARLTGTIRTFKPHVQKDAEEALRRIVDGVAKTYGVAIELDFRHGYPPTVNDQDESDFAARVAADIVGDENVIQDPDPKMGAEDFAYMLLERPGCYIWIGNGPGVGGCWLHNPQYDFNDDALPLGATYWVRLAESRLAPKP